MVPKRMHTKQLTICQRWPKDSRCEAIDHVRIFNNDEIQPATTSLPSCGHPHFVTPGLQQLSDCLKSKGKRLCGVQ